LAHSIQYTKKAVKDLRGLSRDHQARVLRKIETLADDPRPREAKKLVDDPPFFRIRVGPLRVKYAVSDEQEMVMIARVRKRGDAYKRRK